jgi:hypothetical protein
MEDFLDTFTVRRQRIEELKPAFLEKNGFFSAFFQNQSTNSRPRKEKVDKKVGTQ